jgi:arginine exporter protein ArgO
MRGGKRGQIRPVGTISRAVMRYYLIAIRIVSLKFFLPFLGIATMMWYGVSVVRSKLKGNEGESYGNRTACGDGGAAWGQDRD